MTHSTTLIQLEKEIKRQKELLTIGKYTEEICELFKRKEEFEIPLVILWDGKRTQVLFEREKLFYLGRFTISSDDITHFLYMTQSDMFGAKRKEIERFKRIFKIVEKALSDDGVDGAYGVVTSVIRDILK